MSSFRSSAPWGSTHPSSALLRVLWVADLSRPSERERLELVARACRDVGLDASFLWPVMEGPGPDLRERRCELEHTTLIALDWSESAPAELARAAPDELRQAVSQILVRERPALVLLAQAEEGTDKGVGVAQSSRAAMREFTQAATAAAAALDVSQICLPSALLAGAWRLELDSLQELAERCRRAGPLSVLAPVWEGAAERPLESLSWGDLQRRVAQLLERLLERFAQAAPGPFSQVLGSELACRAQEALRGLRKAAEHQRRFAEAARAAAIDDSEHCQKADLHNETLQAERGWLRNAVRFLEGERDSLRGRADVLTAELAVERAGSRRAKGHARDLAEALEALQAEHERVFTRVQELNRALGVEPVPGQPQASEPPSPVPLRPQPRATEN
jgi:hypothetical protein